MGNYKLRNVPLIFHLVKVFY